MPPVPAKHYDIFITAFEKYVHEKQRQIAKVDGLHKPYEIARQCLERARLTNDTRLTLDTDAITITIYVKDGDKSDFYMPLIRDIGEELVAARLRATSQPTSYSSNFNRSFYWHMEGYTTTIDVSIDIPTTGTDLISVSYTDEKEITSKRNYYVKWHDKPHGLSREQHRTHKDMEDDRETPEVPF